MKEETTYSLTTAQNNALLSIISAPTAELRQKTIEAETKQFGRLGLVYLFSEFVGMVKSIEDNSRKYTRDYLQFMGIKIAPGHGPNLPTMMGALIGATNAEGVDQKATCETCAYRVGSPANQSASTGVQAIQCKWDREPFYCHEGLSVGVEPKRLCGGFAQKTGGMVKADSRATRDDDAPDLSMDWPERREGDDD